MSYHVCWSCVAYLYARKNGFQCLLLVVIVVWIKRNRGSRGIVSATLRFFFNWSTAPFPSRVARHHRSGRLLSFGRLRRRGTLWRSAPGSKKPTASIVMDVAVQDDGFHPSIEARCIRALDACHRSGKRSRASPWAQSLQLRRTTASINQLHLVLFLPLW